MSTGMSTGGYPSVGSGTQSAAAGYPGLGGSSGAIGAAAATSGQLGFPSLGSGPITGGYPSA